jgi:hypothetical protein
MWHYWSGLREAPGLGVWIRERHPTCGDPSYFVELHGIKPDTVYVADGAPLKTT